MCLKPASDILHTDTDTDKHAHTDTHTQNFTSYSNIIHFPVFLIIPFLVARLTASKLLEFETWRLLHTFGAPSPYCSLPELVLPMASIDTHLFSAQFPCARRVEPSFLSQFILGLALEVTLGNLYNCSQPEI